jgi:hypothetical protein
LASIAAFRAFSAIFTKNPRAVTIPVIARMAVPAFEKVKTVSKTFT